MNQQLLSFSIDCDAPPYPVVRACRLAGFRSPEDVRWLRLPGARPSLLSDLLQMLHAWPARWQPRRRAAPSCPCGGRLPALDHYDFTYSSGATSRYVLSQCPRCRTMHWEEVKD